MKLDQVLQLESEVLLRTYERNRILFVGGEGVYLHAEGGEKYLDLLSGIGVNALGYGNAALEETIASQSRKLLHTSNLFFHEGQAELARRLVSMTGLDRAFFCNSGSEAWEAALKLARSYARLRTAESKPLGTKILALEGSFHGRTMGSLSTTHKAKYRVPYEPLVEEVQFIRFNDIAHLEERFSADVCAICIEPIQGEGGIRPVSKQFFAIARKLTQTTGALLLADEIQSGVGRTGKWCAYQHYGILPDITTLAKPLAGGLPLGAMLCSEEAARTMEPGLHGTTFGGGPLACAAALTVLDEMERLHLLEHASVVGQYFVQGLRDLAIRHAAIVDVRGIGLMIGVELRDAVLATEVAEAMMQRRIIINRTSDTVLRFLPPYILESKHVDLAISALDEILTERSDHLVVQGTASGTNHG